MRFQEILNREMHQGIGDEVRGRYHFNHHQEEADRIKNELFSKLSMDKYNRKVQMNKTFWEDEE